jgi:membrane protein YdbS with pleckstrin-like domain
MSNSPVDPEEKVVWTGSVSNWHYAGKWLFIVILFAAVIASFLLSPGSFGIDPSMAWIARGALAVLAIFLLIWIRLDRNRRRYTVTNKRVSVEFGIIAKSSNEMRIQDIRSINLATTGLSGMVGIGRLEFSSAATDDADVIFWNVPGAEKIRDMVRGLQA